MTLLPPTNMPSRHLKLNMSKMLFLIPLPRKRPLPRLPHFVRSAQLLKPKIKTSLSFISNLTSSPVVSPPQLIWTMSSHCPHSSSSYNHLLLRQMLALFFFLNVTCNPDHFAIILFISLLQKS